MNMDRNKTSLCLFLVITALIVSKVWHDTLSIFLIQNAQINQEKCIRELEQRQQWEMRRAIQNNINKLSEQSPFMFAVAHVHMQTNDELEQVQKNEQEINSAKELLSKKWNAISKNIIIATACGGTIGAFIAGMLTNVFGAPTILPMAVFAIFSISLMIMHCMNYVGSIYAIILIYILSVLRGGAIAASMNASYGYIGLLYKNDKPGLTSATSKLYIALFIILGITPRYAQFLSTQFYVWLAFICMVVSVALAYKRDAFVDDTTEKEFKLSVEVKRYISSFPLLFNNAAFIMLCFTSMLCIGGFYNIIYIVKEIPAYTPYLATIQQYARLSAAVMIIFINNLPGLLLGAYNIFAAKKQKHMSHYFIKIIRIVLLILSICGIIIIMQAIKLNRIDTLLYGFMLTFASASASQVFTKTDIISTANTIHAKTQRQVIGTAQAAATLANNAFEWIGSMLILGIYNGHSYYLISCVALYVLVLLSQLLNFTKKD